MAAKRASTTKQAEAPAKQPGPKPSRGNQGRNTKRTPETWNALIKAIGEIGLTDKSACDYAGVSQEFFYCWIHDDSVFSEAIQRARAKFKAAHAANIARQAQADWKASSWLLSHRFPEEYAERAIVDNQTASPLDKLFEPAKGDAEEDAEA